MIWTFLVAVASLIIAILGCALLKPLGSLESHYDSARHLWRGGPGSGDHAADSLGY
jgi:hypothetical protein